MNITIPKSCIYCDKSHYVTVLYNDTIQVINTTYSFTNDTTSTESVYIPIKKRAMCLFCGDINNNCNLALIESLNHKKEDTFYCKECNILFHVNKSSAHAIVESNNSLIPCKSIIPENKDLLVPVELITHYSINSNTSVNMMPSFKSLESCRTLINNGTISNIIWNDKIK